MDKPLVSVIICCYNQRETVARAIDSVLMQRCDFPFEIIIGDDASTDGTADICRGYRERCPGQVKLVDRPENLGLVPNYFDGVRRARGTYIADCAGDDFWLGEERLQHLVDALRRHPSAAMACGLHADYDPEKDTLTPAAPPDGTPCFDEKDFGRALAARFLSRQLRPDIVLSAALYRKDLLDRYFTEGPERFLDGRYPAEDISVTAALLMQGPVCFLPEINLAYRLQAESVNHSADPLKYLRFCRRTFVQTLEWAEYLNIEAEDLQPWLSEKIRWYVDLAFRSGSLEEAERLRRACRRYGRRLPWGSALKCFLLHLPFFRAA